MKRLLQLDGQAFGERFGREPFEVAHGLASEPLLELPALLELAAFLPAKSVEYNAGDIPRGIDPRLTPGNGLSAQETIRRIEECRSWLVLKNVERHPCYSALLDACLEDVAVHSERIEPGMHDREAFIFVSSPGSVTPFHMDPEQNFLLQVRGHKTMNVFAAANPRVISPRDVESFYRGAHRNLPWRDEIEPLAQAFELRPGTGLHVPVTAPHWVKNGSEVSISFSITFQTKATARNAHAHRMNAALREWGWTPRPVGESPATDAVKHLLSRVRQKVDRTFAR